MSMNEYIRIYLTLNNKLIFAKDKYFSEYDYDSTRWLSETFFDTMDEAEAFVKNIDLESDNLPTVVKEAITEWLQEVKEVKNITHCLDMV